MTAVTRELPVGELRSQLSDILSAVSFGHERVGVTRNGKLVAVMVSPAELDLLDRIEMAEDVRDYDLAKAASDGTTVSHEELMAELATETRTASR